MEQLIVTPLKPFELILGKTIPFIIISQAQMILVIAFAILWFKIPLVGNAFWIPDFEEVVRKIADAVLYYNSHIDQVFIAGNHQGFHRVGLDSGGWSRMHRPKAQLHAANLFDLDDVYLFDGRRDVVVRSRSDSGDLFAEAAHDAHPARADDVNARQEPDDDNGCHNVKPDAAGAFTEEFRS